MGMRCQAEMVADDPDDSVPNLPQGQVGVEDSCVACWEIALDGIGPTEHAELDDLLKVQRLLGHACSTMRSLCYIRRTNLLVARAMEPSGRAAGGLMPRRGERRSR